MPVYVRTPKDFGPDFWSVLEELAVGYPERADAEMQLSMKQTLAGIAKHFPCIECSRHFTPHVAKMEPKDLYGRMGLTSWIINTHNTVNKRLGKPVYSFPEAMKLIATKYERRKADAKKLASIAASGKTGSSTNDSLGAARIASCVFICLVAVIVLSLAWNIGKSNWKLRWGASGLGIVFLGAALGLQFSS